MADLPDILQRTASQWVAVNPFLPKGMLAIESDTGRKKYGTGQRYLATAYVPDETTAELPPSATSGDVLMYTSGAWSAASLDVGDISGLQDVLDGKQDELAAGAEGQVLTYVSGEWVAASPSGGGASYDQSLNTTDSVQFTQVMLSNGTTLAVGSFDTSMGGSGGISLNCLVGYELNWQAGHLVCTADGGATYSPILCDSAIEFPGVGTANMQIDAAGLTFPDGTTQTTAGGGGGGIPAPSSPNGGDLLSYNSAAMEWVATAPTWGIPSPASINDGDVLTYSVSASAWIASPPTGIPAPGSPSSNDVLSYNGSSWIAVAPTTPGLPSGTQGQYLKYDGTNWVSGSVFPSSPSTGQYLQYDGTDWVAASMTVADYSPSTGYNTGDLVSYANTIWRATSTGMGNAPAYGSMYWANLSLIDNNPIGAPSMPSDGNVLTYSSIANAWVAAAPAGGATYLHARLTSDETATSALASSALSLSSIAGSSTYLVEGLAIMEGDQAQAIQLALSAYDNDGDVHLDHDYAVAVDLSEWMVAHNLDQTSFSQCVNADTWSGTITAPVRFRALVVTGAISSTNLNVYFGPSSLSGSTYLKAGSWITATKLA